MRGPLVALEGLSGVGKSTIALIVAETIGGVVFKTPSGVFAECRDLVDRGDINPTSRYFFYLASVVDSSKEIDSLLKKHAVVCDRYVLTTQCYHAALGVKTIDLSKLPFVTPNETFLITCDEEQRISRLAHRGLSYNDRQEALLKIDARFLAEYRKNQLQEVDNSLMDPFVAAQEIVSRVKNRWM